MERRLKSPVLRLVHRVWLDCAPSDGWRPSATKTYWGRPRPISLAQARHGVSGRQHGSVVQCGTQGTQHLFASEKRLAPTRRHRLLAQTIARG